MKLVWSREMYNNSGNCKGMVYVVKEGDTLYKIAREYDLKLIDVLKANPYVNVYNLQIGDELCLPTLPNRGLQENIPESPADSSAQDDRSRNDWNLQNQNNMQEFNDQNDNDGDRDWNSIDEQDRNDSDRNDQNMQIYEIREGDTLADLLQYFQTDYDDLLVWNPGLKDLPIPMGVVVRFPQS